MSFCIVKTNINFAFYFFVSTRSASQDYLQKRREKMEEEGKTEETKKADKMAKSLRYVQLL